MLIIPSPLLVSIELGIWRRSHLLIRLRIGLVTNMISRIAIRPLLFLSGMSRWESTPMRELAIRVRICPSISLGKNWSIRLMVSTLPEVWRVDITKCPVSASDSAISIVSASRISPIIITSASSRIAERIAVWNERVSLPISR